MSRSHISYRKPCSHHPPNYLSLTPSTHKVNMPCTIHKDEKEMVDVEEPVRGSIAEPSFQALQRPAASLVQTKPVLQQIKRDPYIFIAHHYVPVLNATVAHLKKRLRGYGWKDILVDSA